MLSQNIRSYDGKGAEFISNKQTDKQTHRHSTLHISKIYLLLCIYVSAPWYARKQSAGSVALGDS